MGTPPSHPPQPALDALSRGVDVELALQDVVDDRLTQVVHHVAVSMLEGQSVGQKEKHRFRNLPDFPQRQLEVQPTALTQRDTEQGIFKCHCRNTCGSILVAPSFCFCSLVYRRLILGEKDGRIMAHSGFKERE